MRKSCRHLIFILGDQLDLDSAALADADPKRDVVLMAEVPQESTHVWSIKPRTAFFFTAMRHFAAGLGAQKFKVDYRRIGTHDHNSLIKVLQDALHAYAPQKIVMVSPGDWRIEQALNAYAETSATPLAMREDTHFMCGRHEFAEWARGYKQMRLEYFYRMMRRRYDVLMEGDQPHLGRWNFDSENRGAFPKAGPVNVPQTMQVSPDTITQEVIADVEKYFADHPGTTNDFAWPVTRQDALIALQKFIEQRLPVFGEFQDAMWTDEPFLYHAHISAAMNVKLLNPREVIAATLAAYQAGRAPIEAVEGFIRQILGWREFMRGVYWLDMPAMRDANHFQHQRDLPAWYWTGDTHMQCMRQTIAQTLKYGYAHHIQRLMVTGIFALMAEVSPKLVEDWYLAVYIDAVDWVELPNVAGMALYANGGRFTSKPYIASGQYIKRMSNYCAGCRYKPDVKTGATACPVTTLYWYFLDKHEKTLLANPRTALMAKNIGKLAPDVRAALRTQAGLTLKKFGLRLMLPAAEISLRYAALAKIDAIHLATYARTRNALSGHVSKLSPYITHGITDVPEIITRLQTRASLGWQDKFAFELGWREYFHHVWRVLGDDIWQDRRPLPGEGYASAMPADIVNAVTGIVMVDAEIRRLYTEGWLHNHARMWLASYIVHLRKVDWRVGARWMYAHLLDGDIASNTLSWQWIAGTWTGKPYLFNADNIARYAPEYTQQGTEIDTTYDALEKIARSAAVLSPQHADNISRQTPTLLENEALPIPALIDASIVNVVSTLATALNMQVLAEIPATFEGVLVHPWSIRVRTATPHLGLIVAAHHQQSPWSLRRWQFVMRALREVTDTIVILQSPTHSLTPMPCTSCARIHLTHTNVPAYAKVITSLAVRGATVHVAPRAFIDPATLQPSFSAFWHLAQKESFPT